VERRLIHTKSFYKKRENRATAVHYNPPVLRVEFHCHSLFSEDSLVPPKNLVAACRRKGIDRVVVTDHNTIAGALAARDLDPDRVIVGEEILTRDGELLAAFVTAEVPAGLSPLEAIARLRDQGAFISVSHPFDRSRKGAWQVERLLEIMGLVDAIEVYNSRCMLPVYNRLAAEFSRVHDLAGTVGSDAHSVWELGRSTLLLPSFTDADGLREALRQGVAEARWSPPWVHLMSRYATLHKRLART
jgi:predicted metal-dependent phosphoesterase TrpH